MNIFDLEFENWNILVLKFNWIVVVIMLILLWGIVFLIKKCMKYTNKKSIMVDEVNLGIGSSSVKLSYSKKDQEIAYKIWVELSTRKIGLYFDKENDVIKEVYDSWYEFFGIARELLKDIPPNQIAYSMELIELTEMVLNVGLRPHLTKWQAKYRKWYDEQLENNIETPQEIQKKYSEYAALVADMLEVNKRMIEYKKLMKRIAFENIDIDD